MRRLISVEFRRVFARDMTRLLGLIALLLATVAGIGAFVSTNSSSDVQEAQFDRTILAQRADVAARIEKCSTTGDTPETPPDLVRSGINPEMFNSQFEPRSKPQCRAQLSRSGFPEGDQRFHLLSMPESLEGLIGPTTIFALIIGATMIGAEWGAGTIPNLLIWEPRRWRILLAKMGAVLAASSTLFLLFALFIAGALTPAFLFHGTAVGLDATWREDLTSVAVRGIYLPALGGLFGFAFALLIRNTAAALGAAFGYLLIAESLIRATGALHAWLVSSNAAIVLAGFSPFGSFGNLEPVSQALADRSSLEAGMILGGYTLLVVLVSGFLFHRRDVH